MKSGVPRHAIVAVTYKGGKILCVRKKSPENVKLSNKWLFPGYLLDNLEDKAFDFKCIFRNKVYCYNHITDALYIGHPHFDIVLHFYSCLVDTDVVLCKDNQYDDLQWVFEEDLQMVNKWPECYANVLYHLRPINKHICSSVRYNLFGKYNYVRNLCCHESVAQYGAEKYEINNVLVACCNDKILYERVIKAAKYQTTSVREENEEPINVDCLVFYSTECGYCMFTVRSTYIEQSDLEGSCVLSYELAEENMNYRILSIAAAAIKANTNINPFILSFENT